jgi:hypothetical protein
VSSNFLRWLRAHGAGAHGTGLEIARVEQAKPRVHVRHQIALMTQKQTFKNIQTSKSVNAL